MGPSGRYAIIDNGVDRPVVTKDGVTVARSITLPDRFEEMGAHLVKEAAERTNATAGDGTTLTCLLTGALFESVANLAQNGADASSIARELGTIATSVVSSLERASKPATSDDIRHVALVSSNHEATIATPIAELLLQVGLDGLVTVSMTDSPGLTTDVLDGLKVDAGYASPLMATERFDAVMHSPMVLLTDKPLKKVDDVLPAMKIAKGSGAGSLLIFADDADHDVLAFLLTNKANFLTVVVKTPGFGPERKLEVLGDLKAKLGGRLLLENMGHSFGGVTQDDLGAAKQALITKDACLVIGGRGTEEDVKGRVELIELDLAKAEYDFDKDRLRKRRANLYGKLGVIRVGGTTKSETVERKHRVEDVVCAIRAAMEEGVVTGAGVAILEAGARLKASETLSFTEAAAVEALSTPYRTILENAGLLTEERRDCAGLNPKEPWVYGYDAKNGLMVNLMEAGIIDPLKVVTESVKNAFAVTALLITTDVIVSEITLKE